MNTNEVVVHMPDAELLLLAQRRAELEAIRAEGHSAVDFVVDQHLMQLQADAMACLH